VSDQQPDTSRWGPILGCGIIVLLPGVCSLLVAGRDFGPDNVIWTACLVIGAGGATLITLAIWRGRGGRSARID
jgi:hypothetical protein